MKKTVSVMTILVLALAAIPSFANETNPRQMPFQPVTVKLELRNTPDFKVGNYSNHTQNNARQKWAVIDVDFNAKQISGSNFWMDSVKMEAVVIAPTILDGSKTGYAVFSGTTEFWTVQFDGKNHKAMMAIPPKIVDRTLTPGFFSADSFLVRVRFVSAGQTLGEAYSSNVRRNEQMALFAAADAESNDMIKISGALLPKNKTPWEYIDYDIYDLVRE